VSVRQTVAGVLLVAALALAVGLPALGLQFGIDGNEARHAEIAREMFTTGEWLVPHQLGKPYIDKPPLYNWVVAAVFQLAGRSGLALARLPSVVTAAIIAVAVYLLGLRWLDRRAALLAAVMWIAFPINVRWARMARGDLFMSGLIVCAVFLAALAADARSKGRALAWWTAASLMAGAALMSKGPQAIFFIAVPVAAMWKACRGRWAPPWPWLVLSAVLLCAAGSAWSIACELRYPGHMSRLAGYQYVTGFVEHPSRVCLYADQLFLLTLPWAVFCFGAFRDAWRRLKRQGLTRLDVAALVTPVCALAMTLVPNKRAHYLLPLLPFWALFLAGYMTRAAASPEAQGQTWARLFRLALAATLAGAALLAVAGPAAWAAAGGPAPGLAAAAVVAAALAVLAGWGAWHAWRGRCAKALLALAAASAAASVAAFPLVQSWAGGKVDPEVKAAREISALLPPGLPVASAKMSTFLIFFAFDRSVAFPQTDEDLARFLNASGPRAVILDAENFAILPRLTSRPVKELGRWTLKTKPFYQAVAARVD